MATGKREKDSNVLESEWDRWACLLGWPVVGVFGSDDGEVSAIEVSGEHKAEYRVIALGDNLQKVHLLRYPALTKVPHKLFSGHASHVTRVKFSPDGGLLFSSGGRDKSVIQWRHVPIPKSEN